MTTLREWKEKRPNYSLLETLTFFHSSFPDSYRCIKNKFNDTQINGLTYKPSSFSVTEPAQDGTASISLTITFLMAAEEIRSILKKYWVGSARMQPISCNYQIWGSNGDESPMISYALYVKDISSDATNVTVTLSLTNPLTLGTDKIYRVSDYPGLITS